jgi:hypothetical protein
MGIEKPKRKKNPALTRRDALKIIGATGTAVVVTQLGISGPLSPDAVQGIGAATHHNGDLSDHQWHMVIDLSVCIGCAVTAFTHARPQTMFLMKRCSGISSFVNGHRPARSFT